MNVYIVEILGISELRIGNPNSKKHRIANPMQRKSDATEQLKSQLPDASRKERQKIEQKIKNITQNAKKKESRTTVNIVLANVVNFIKIYKYPSKQ